MTLSPAEKQKRYRERKRIEREQMEQMKSIIEMIHNKSVTLRKTSKRIKRERNRDVFISVNNGIIKPHLHKIMSGSYVACLVEDTVFNYMLTTGMVVYREKVYGSDIYDFVDLDDD